MRRAGTYFVNFYQDATVELDGVRFEISGNYPVGNAVTVNGKGYAAKLSPLPSDGMTWGRWKLELTKDGASSVNVKVCDFESGSDEPCGEGGDLCSVLF